MGFYFIINLLNWKSYVAKILGTDIKNKKETSQNKDLQELNIRTNNWKHLLIKTYRDANI